MDEKVTNPYPAHVEKAERLARSLGDWRRTAGPLPANLARAVSNALLDGRLALGVRLPSERALAGALGVSRATVAKAYSLLRGEEWLTTAGRSGSVAQLPPELTRRIAPWSGDVSTAKEDVIDLVVAAPAAPLPVYVEAATAAAGGLYRHAGTSGLGVVGELRAGIAERYTADGLPTRPDEVLVTAGSMAALTLVGTLILGPGARVVVEKPTYPEAMSILRAARLRLAGWPVGDGWDPLAFRDMLAALRPAAAYVVPDFHNPLGFLVADDVRAAVADAAARQRTWLIVDETMIDLDLRPRPRSPRRAEGPRALRLGSLSKLVWSGLRVGWLRTDAELVRRLEQAPLTRTLTPAIGEQLIALRLLEQLAAVARERRHQLARQRAALLLELERWPAVRLPRAPDGGLTAWVELAAGLSSVDVARRASAHGVLLTPGGRFSPDGGLDRFLRLPFTQPEEKLTRGIERLRALFP